MSRAVRTAVALAAVLVAVVAVQAGAGGAQRSGTLSARDELENALLRQINTLRRQHGLTSLRVNVGLRAAADGHSSAMATEGFFAHASSNGTQFWQRVRRSYTKTRYWSVGENLLWSSPDVDHAGALQMWLNSAPHRKNLLTARWREIGISAVHVDAGPGVYRGLPVTIVTADFGVRR